MAPFSKVVFVSVAATLVVCGLGSIANAADMVSYRAVYDIRLDSAKNGASISGVTGQLAYGMKDTCTSWLVNQSGTMYFETSAGDVIPQPLGFSSWESSDGTQFRFTSLGEGGDNAILGGAKKGKDGGAGEAQFSKPEEATFPLPAGTLFPAEHTAFILQQALAGKTQFENMVFEGVEVEGPKLLVTFVSPLSERARNLAAGFKIEAMTQPGWNFRLAYFDPASRTGEPILEIEADYLDNGIPVRWIVDYGDFIVEMSMSKIEILPKPGC